MRSVGSGGVRTFFASLCTGGYCFFFFQAEDGIRDIGVTGVQTCALPICLVYALEGSIFVTGAAVQWLRDGLGLIDSANEIEGLARTVPDSGDVVFVPALTGMGAPHWDPHARGAILGITRGTTRAHLARATLEAIAFEVRDVVDIMVDEAGLEVPELSADGGASANDLLLQLQADQLGAPVRR